jgi:hypothetical protein
MFFWWLIAVQEQKEAAMIKALENNMGDVDMVSAEGAILGPIACFDSVGRFLENWCSGDCKGLT